MFKETFKDGLFFHTKWIIRYTYCNQDHLEDISSILTFWTTPVGNCNTPLIYFRSLPTTIVLLFQLVKYLLYSHTYNLGRDSSETVVGNVEAWATSSCILLMSSESPWIDAGCTISILMQNATHGEKSKNIVIWCSMVKLFFFYQSPLLYQ